MVDTEIYIEAKQIGKIIKISAIDARTGVEVCIQGPADGSFEALKKVAVEKLQYRLRQLAKT